MASLQPDVREGALPAVLDVRGAAESRLRLSGRLWHHGVIVPRNMLLVLASAPFVAVVLWRWHSLGVFSQ